MFAQNLTFPHFEEQIRKIDTVVIPTGSFEAHGRHCPLGTDIIIRSVFAKIWILPWEIKSLSLLL